MAGAGRRLRRLSRLSKVIAGVGFGYAGSVILSGGSVQKARGWRAKFRAATAAARDRWHALALPLKLLIVAALIAVQLSLHSLLIVFPIAFLVPVVRRLWVRVADLMFGTWYWKTFGRMHRAIGVTLRHLPLVGGVIGATRLVRIRYLCAWRLWKHDPRYRDPNTDRPRVKSSRTDPPLVAGPIGQLCRTPAPIGLWGSTHETLVQQTRCSLRCALKPVLHLLVEAGIVRRELIALSLGGTTLQLRLDAELLTFLNKAAARD